MAGSRDRLGSVGPDPAFDAGWRRCSCLAAHLDGVRASHPAYHAAPVPAFGDPRARLLIDSYHCSRCNTRTGRLTVPMFEAVMKRACACFERGCRGSRGDV